LSGAIGQRYTVDVKKPNKPVLAVVIAAQMVSCAFAWRDLARRSADQVRGPKNLWRVFITVNPGNSIVYWLIGRRSSGR
jgi:hypothetical protein